MADRFTAPPALDGRIVRMEPLEPRHADQLYEAAKDPRVWRLMRYNGAESRERFQGWVDEALDGWVAGTEYAFATVRRSDDRAVGSSRFLSMRPEDRSIEIGWTWVTPELWGTGVNAEAKLLMMTYAFEQLGCLRVEFKTDASNERSRAALAALPAEFEGVHRKHQVVRGGERRDSAWYAVIDDDWPEVKAALTSRVERMAAGA
jgi:N-acetyltransferase